MTTFLEQPDQAAVDVKRRDEWRLTLDREVQMNTMQIEQMQQTVSRPAVAGGIAGELQQFIARRGWEIGYATMSGVVKRWDSFREWVEDYPDNGGLHTTVTKVLPYVCQVEVKANEVQHKAIKSMMSALDPIDRLAIRPDAMRIAEVLGDQEIVDLVHDETRRPEGGNGSNQHKSNTRTSTHVAKRSDPRGNKQAARQQLRDYAADPKRCERYGKDHALCQEAWIKHEAGELSITDAQILCGLRKREAGRMIYIVRDTEKMADQADKAMSTEHLASFIQHLQERLNARQ